MAVIGLNKLLAELRKVPRDVQFKKLDNAVRAGAVVVLKRAKDTYVPTGETGRLKNSLFTQKNREASTKESSTYTIGYNKGKSRDDPSGAYYGGFVELGTRNMGAQPFLRPALETELDNAIEAIRSKLQKALKLK